RERTDTAMARRKTRTHPSLVRQTRRFRVARRNPGRSGEIRNMRLSARHPPRSGDRESDGRRANPRAHANNRGRNALRTNKDESIWATTVLQLTRVRGKKLAPLVRG